MTLRSILFLLFAALTTLTCFAAPLLEYKSKEDVTLPPLGARRILGTWPTAALPPIACTRSFEEVKGKVYDVIRCSDGSGGNDGRELTRVSSNKFFSRTSTSGDHYVILKSGDLSVRDKDGFNWAAIR